MSESFLLELYKELKDIRFYSYLLKLSLSFVWFFVISLIIVFCTSNFVDYFWVNIEIYENWTLKKLAIVILFLIWLFYRLFKNFLLPRNDNNKIWIVIAINDWSNYEWFTLKYDFIRSLKENLDTTKFKIIEMPKRYFNRIAKTVKELNKENIMKYNEKIDGHYWICGKTEKRKDWVKKCYIETNSMVFHANIPTDLQTELLMDYNNLYPRSISFDEDWYKSWITFGWEHNAIVALYIIGVALLISNNPFWAWDLHKDLHLKLNSIPKKDNVETNFNETYIDLIAKKIRVIQYRELWLICNYYYVKKEYPKWSSSLNLWRQIANNYNFFSADLCNQEGIYEFLINKNIKKSRSFIKEAWKYGHKYHVYSLIFLDLYDRNYKSVNNRMKKIIKKNTSVMDIVSLKEIIQFIEDVLEIEPNRYEFLYRLSLLYYKKLGNEPMAYSTLMKYIKCRNKKEVYEIIPVDKIKKELEKYMDKSLLKLPQQLLE